MKVIHLKDGTIITTYNARTTLGNLLYDYCGNDAYQLFDEYVDGLIEDIEWYKDDAEYWKDLYNGYEEDD